MAAPGKFIGITAPSESMVYLLDDSGQIWCRYLDSGGAWKWVFVDPPVVEIIREDKTNIPS